MMELFAIQNIKKNCWPIEIVFVHGRIFFKIEIITRILQFEPGNQVSFFIQYYGSVPGNKRDYGKF